MFCNLAVEINSKQNLIMVNLNIKIPDGFLDEEVRCDYLVSSKMKRIWAVELDLLNEFQRVAQKYNIKYIANNGTMLGAVRHRGFIPWDDDIDIMMMRSEYNKLCSVAEKEFHYPYFFQTEYTDPGCFRCHAQLRNSETTAILKNELRGKLKFNQGIFMDIFPIDAVPDDDSEWEKECRIAQKYYERMCGFANSSTLFVPDDSQPNYLMKQILHMFAKPIMRKLARYYFKKYETECIKYNHLNTQKVCLYCWGYKYKKLHRARIDHEETMMADFEFMKIPICKNYDHALTEVFGDWHKFVKGGALHDGILFDVDIPYKEYLK